VFNVTAYAIAEELHLESLRKHIQEQGLYHIVPLPSGTINQDYSIRSANIFVIILDCKDVLHVEAKYVVDGDGEPREIFFFRY
jgi:hypothetical protein